MVRLTDCLNLAWMAIAFDLDFKPQVKQNPLSKMVPSSHSMALNLINQNPFNSVLFLQAWYR